MTSRTKKSLLVVSVAAMVLLLFLVLPMATDEIQWFRSSHSDGAEDYRAYLESRPGGRHAAEARNLYDDRCWTDTKRENNIQAFEQYLQVHPRGKHAAEARENLDSFYWQEASSANTIQALERYKKLCPEGKHAKEARESLDSLRWQEAAQTNSFQAFERYLQYHPAGNHVGEAQESMEAVTWQDACNGNTFKTLQIYLDKYPAGRFADEAKSKQETLLADDAPFSLAKEKGTEEALTAFLSEFPGHQREKDALRLYVAVASDGQYSERARALEQTEYERTEALNLIPVYKKYLSDYPVSPHRSDASAKLDELLERRIDPFQGAETVRITVRFTGSGDCGFSRAARELSENAGLRVVTEDDTAFDVDLRIEGRSEVFRANYLNEQTNKVVSIFAGARLEGSISLRRNDTTKRAQFSGTFEPPERREATYFDAGKEDGVIATSTRISAFYMFGYPVILKLFAEVFGGNVLVSQYLFSDNLDSRDHPIPTVLAEHPDPNVLASFRAALKFDHDDNAITALGILKDEEAVDLLGNTMLLTDSSAENFGEERWKAAIALDRIGSDKAVEALWRVLQEGKSPDRDDIAMRVEAGSALANRKDYRCVQSLINILGEEDAFYTGVGCKNRSESYAERALGILGKLTGQSLGEDKSKWQEWWDNNKDKSVRKGSA